MLRRTMGGVLAMAVVIGAAARWGAAADKAAPAETKAAAPLPAASVEPPSAQWRTDPACQLVFFAVLEGLYTDGVPDEAVNLIVPPDAGGDGVKHSFVFRCPLCHAAYEAFVLYQNRTAFNGSGEKRSTMGKSGRVLARTAATTSRPKRVRFSRLPPYWSVRVFVTGQKN